MHAVRIVRPRGSMSVDDRAAYLARLGLEAEPPSAEALIRLHRAQVEQVPYETLWIHTGQRWGVDLDESVARIANVRRGGYCFHLNGAFSVLLESLGYDVTRHVGGVHGPVRVPEQEMANHLVLTVAGLPTDDNPRGTWYVDAGLGDALHEPTPLVAGPLEQPPFSMRLDETPGDVGDWHLTHGEAGGFAGMAWHSAPATIDDFRDKHEWLSTAPESGFVRVPDRPAARRHRRRHPPRLRPHPRRRRRHVCRPRQPDRARGRPHRPLPPRPHRHRPRRDVVDVGSHAARARALDRRRPSLAPPPRVPAAGSRPGGAIRPQVRCRRPHTASLRPGSSSMARCGRKLPLWLLGDVQGMADLVSGCGEVVGLVGDEGDHGERDDRERHQGVGLGRRRGRTPPAAIASTRRCLLIEWTLRHRNATWASR